MIVYGYGRCSTDKQELTEDVQKTFVHDWYAREFKGKGYQWGGFLYDEAVNGGKPFTEREQGLRLWIMLASGDVIIAQHSDRAFRDTADGLHTTAMMRHRGVTIRTPDLPYDMSTADGEMMATIQFALNRREKRRTSERTSAIMKALVAKGVQIGRARTSHPFGWRRSGTGLIEDPGERRQIEEIASLRTKGHSFARLEMILRQPPYSWQRSGGMAWNAKYIGLALKARDLGYPKCYLNSRSRRRAAVRTPA